MTIVRLEDIFQKISYEELPTPKVMLDELFYNTTNWNISWHLGIFSALKKAFLEDKEALRKAMRETIRKCNNRYREAISKYPDLKESYRNAIKRNEKLTERLDNLW